MLMPSEHLWNDDVAIRQINQTYEMDATVDVWNYRALQVRPPRLTVRVAISADTTSTDH